MALFGFVRANPLPYRFDQCHLESLLKLGGLLPLRLRFRP